MNIQNSLGTYTKTFSGPFLPCQMRAASLAKGAARLSYAGAILGGLFTLRYQQSEAAPSYTILSG